MYPFKKLDTLMEAEREDAKYFKENGIDPISDMKSDKMSMIVTDPEKLDSFMKNIDKI